MTTITPKISAATAAVIERWYAGDRFGVLCTGDPLIAEGVYRALAPTADHAFGNAESVGAADLAGLSGDRLVALAWDAGDVHPALARRCTAILDCGDTTGFPRAVKRLPADLIAATMRVLDVAGVRDHGVEIAAARLVEGLHRGGCSDPLWVLRALVANPRRRRVIGPDPNGETGAEDEHVGDDDLSDDPFDDSEDVADSVDESDAADGGPAEEDSTGESDGEGDGDGEAEGAAEQLEPTDDTEVPPAVMAATDVDITALSEPTGAPGDASVDAVGAGQGTLGVQQGRGELGPNVSGEQARADVGWQAGARRSRRVAKHLRGGRGAHSLSTEHGPVVRVVSPERVGGRIAVVPTLQRAARRRALSGDVDDGPLQICRDDLRGTLRRRRGGNHTVIVVDGSSSLGPSGLRTAGSAAEQAVAAITARRGVVSVIVASGQQAHVAVERSTSLARTRQALTTAQTGGGTPLAHAVALAIELLDADEKARRQVLLLTDGRPTVGLSGAHLPTADARAEIARLLADLTGCVPDVTLIPIGFDSSSDRALFAAAGVIIGNAGRNS